MYTHDYRAIESLVTYVPGLSQTAPSSGANTGKGGMAVEGVATHYFYGMNASTNYKVGMSIMRTDVPVLSRFAKDGASATTAGQYNVGKLLPSQKDCFNNLFRQISTFAVQSRR